MTTPIDWWRRRQLKRRYFARPRARASTTAKVAIAVLVLILALAAVLELRDRAGQSLAARFESAGVDPVELVAAAGRRSRVVVLGDVSGSSLPKQLAADVVDRLATEQGLDAVGVEVEATAQPWIDDYLESNPEDASILLSRPQSLGEGGGTDRAYLELYRRVWRLNQSLGPDRRVRLIALDLPEWPPRGAVSPATAAALYAQRDSVMWLRLHNRILTREPRARLVVFVDGLHALQTEASVRTGGTSTKRFPLLAERLRRELGETAVWSALVDAPVAPGVSAPVAKYGGSELFGSLRRNLRSSGGRFGMPVTDELGLRPSGIATVSPPGVELMLEPAMAGQLADAYIYLGG